MADRIKQLPEIVANQIAAGEVVGEPASAVKEMMENALDAGAQCIKVEYENGGLDSLVIVDDGCGMSPADARKAFDKHATSKISSVEDLYALHTFGFRGEALASIAAIAQVELRTRQHDDEIGTETVINGGEFISQKPVMTPAGSRFTVTNMFYNVPAQRKFCKSPSALAANIKTEFRHVALCNHGVGFQLYTGGALVMNLPPASRAGRIVDIIGQSIKQNLLETDADTSIVRIKGYVGRPRAAKRRGGEQYLFVNGRYFRSTFLHKAVCKAYEKLIPDSYVPSYFIYLEVDPDRIDVNVSPHKTEVRFADDDAIWQILNAAVRETLAKTGAVPMMDFDNEAAIDIPIPDEQTFYDEPSVTFNQHYDPFAPENNADSGNDNGKKTSGTAAAGSFRSTAYGTGIAPNREFEIAMEQAVAEDDYEEFTSVAFDGSREQELPIDALQPAFSSVTYVGNGYASALYGRQFVVVDLRRAKEQILFERYMNMIRNAAPVSQKLLFPERLVLSNQEYELLAHNIDRFTALGFGIALDGNDSITVNGIPADADEATIDTLVFELLHLFDTPVETDELRNRTLAATLARSNAARSPRNLSNDEAAQLLDQLARTGATAFTPGGKPVMTVITADDLRARLA